MPVQCCVFKPNDMCSHTVPNLKAELGKLHIYFKKIPLHQFFVSVTQWHD